MGWSDQSLLAIEALVRYRSYTPANRQYLLAVADPLLANIQIARVCASGSPPYETAEADTSQFRLNTERSLGFGHPHCWLTKVED